MERIAFWATVAVGVVTAVVFTADPQLDLDIALYFRGVFVDDPQSQVFSFVAALRDINRHVTTGFFFLSALVLVIKLVWPTIPMLMPPRITVLLLATMLLGPGLLINGVLKETWSRPRPGEVVEMQGSLAYKPWWDPRGECRANCSFASGETATAFTLLAVAAVVPAPWTGPAVVVSCAFAFAVGLGRIVTTGHFVTDVVFAAVLMGLLIWLVHGLLFRWPATRMSDAALEAWLERVGATTRTWAVAALPAAGISARLRDLRLW